MRKLFSVILTMGICLTLSGTFAGCDTNENEQPTLDSSKNEVTETEFYSALSFENVVNYSFNVSTKNAIVDGDESVIGFEETACTICVDGGLLHYVYKECSDDSLSNTEMFFELEQDKLYMYAQDGDDFVKTDVTDTIAEIFGEDMIGIPNYFEEGFINRSAISYEDFSYVDGKYVGTMKADENDDRLIDVVLKFESGVLTYFKINDGVLYGLEADDTYVIYEFYDFGATEVALPEEYQDTTKPSDSTNSWSSYFVFDNLTAVKTSNNSVNGMTTIDSDEIKVDDKKWSMYRTDTYTSSSGSYTGHDVVYFDGENAYKDGVLDDSLKEEKDLFFYTLDFSLYEKSFTKTADNTYEASSIDVYGIYTYTDVKIQISGDKISTVSYTLTYSEDYGGYVSVVTATFSNWGTTVVEEPVIAPSLDKYLVFENVSYQHTITMTMKSATEELKEVLVSFIRLNGEEWEYTVEEDDVFVYSDGTNVYLNGEITDIEFTYANGSLANLETFFLKCKTYLTSPDADGVYELSGSVPDMIYSDSDSQGNIVEWSAVYSSAKVVVEGDVLQKVVYQKTATNNAGDKLVYDFEYVFSDWGTTVISK